jgi:hypothetical protein
MRTTLFKLFVVSCLGMTSAWAQVTTTANNSVPPYNTEFLYGTNPGYYNSNWSDIALANIAKGNGTLGCNMKSLRPPLPHEFLDRYGYNIRVTEFNHYKAIGMKDHTIFLGAYFNPASSDPAYVDFLKRTMDSTKYQGGACGFPQSYKKLYEPIWDGGANGTPVNENNPFALYVYKTVSTYKGYCKLWEIVNEPDFCGSAACEEPRGVAGNWWENAPKPCDLVNLKAPVFHYIRMLRIAYEVIKTVDPTAFVAPGGIGYKSFLDVMLRYTDNPVDGSVTSAYPLKGGAYFDVLSYHVYPQYYLRRWSNVISNFEYFRFSDAVADTVINFQKGFQKVLTSRGYDGVTYPKKQFIVTEYNIPRKTYSGTDYIGSDEAQRNAMIKTLVKVQKEGILQFYTYQMGDMRNENDNTSTDWHHLMGLFKNLTTNKPGEQQLTNSGIAMKTTATLLEGYAYDKTRTAALALPTGIEGHAFIKDGKYRYVFWARTKTDRSETASGTYTFPAGLGFSSVTSYDWNYTVDNTKTKALALTNIALTGSPVFFSEGSTVGVEDGDFSSESDMVVYPNPSAGQFSIMVNGISGSGTLKVYSSNGLLVSSQKVRLASVGSVIDHQDQPLESGVYFAQLQTENGSLTRKIVIE